MTRSDRSLRSFAPGTSRIADHADRTRENRDEPTGLPESRQYQSLFVPLLSEPPVVGLARHSGGRAIVPAAAEGRDEGVE